MMHTVASESQGAGESEEKYRGENAETQDGQRALPVFDDNAMKHRVGSYLEAVGAGPDVGFTFSDLPSFWR